MMQANSLRRPLDGADVTCVVVGRHRGHVRVGPGVQQAGHSVTSGTVRCGPVSGVDGDGGTSNRRRRGAVDDRSAYSERRRCRRRWRRRCRGAFIAAATRDGGHEGNGRAPSVQLVAHYDAYLPTYTDLSAAADVPHMWQWPGRQGLHYLFFSEVAPRAPHSRADVGRSDLRLTEGKLQRVEIGFKIRCTVEKSGYPRLS